ncbi:hypothetical protein NDU88_007920 [Pleurodeles waltl]|uniref:Uncharacterized protein n=1 Tax=Pleurodeles waltl TaxID=8319 RepID=A0AAV7PMN9_PLEWA|nr:hypothetical protein NDU88_007920 [Pleurodeles waltl]
MNERLEMFRMQLVTSRTILMDGDFNCTVEMDGHTGSDSAGMDMTPRLLVEKTGEASLQDVIGSMGPNTRNFSWSRMDRSVRSQINILFTSPTVKPGWSSMVAIYFWDHRAISFVGETYREVPRWPRIVETEMLIVGKRGVSSKPQSRMLSGQT